MLPSQLLALALLATPVLAQCPPDGFEPNDDCPSATSLAPGIYTGLRVPDLGVDTYRVSVPAGERIEVTLQLQQPAIELGMLFVLFEDDGSGDPCASFGNAVALRWFGASEPQASLGWGTSHLAGAEFFVRVSAFGAPCTEYSLALDVFPEPCEATPDGGLEDNDECSSALAIGPGSYPGQRVSLADPDYYLVAAGPGELVTLLADELSDTQALLLNAWQLSQGCDQAFTQASHAWPGGVAGLQLYNESLALRTWIVRVLPQPDQATQTGFCIEYDLDLLLEPDACPAWANDPMEPNDVCGLAPLLTGSMSGLGMRAQEHDWYRIEVPSNSTLRLLATPAPGVEKRPMHLYSGCGGNPDFLASDVPYDFVSGETRTWLEWHNPSASSLTTRLFLWRNVSPPASFCTTYDLTLATTLGEPFCLATRNSSGAAARMTAAGSLAVGQGELALTLEPVPVGQFGLVFFGSGGQSFSPFGNGYLCVAGPLVRLPVTTTGAGALTTTIHWSSPGAASAIAAGQTWFFQGWYRDPAAAGAFFNLSEGLRLEFE